MALHTAEDDLQESGETKSGNLMICAGSSARILHHLSSSNLCDRCSNNSKRSSSRDGINLKHVLENANRNKQAYYALRSNSNNIDATVNTESFRCGCKTAKRTQKQMELSKMVKVCVYTKGSRPYLVIYDSTTKFATPVMHQKLKKFRVSPVKNDKDSEDVADEKRFRIYPNMSDDVIIFQTITTEQRDEWASFLSRLTQKEISSASSPLKTSHHLMKSSLSTLEEADEPSDDLQREPLKAPTRRQKSREGRKNSLTSIGVRLLRRPLARPLA